MFAGHATPEQAGYCLHEGTDPADPELYGKWWWTLTQDGWDGVEVGETFDTRGEAEQDMARAFAAEVVAEAESFMEA